MNLGCPVLGFRGRGFFFAFSPSGVTSNPQHRSPPIPFGLLRKTKNCSRAGGRPLTAGHLLGAGPFGLQGSGFRFNFRHNGGEIGNRLVARESDPETGLYYHRAGYYDAIYRQIPEAHGPDAMTWKASRATYVGGVNIDPAEAGSPAVRT